MASKEPPNRQTSKSITVQGLPRSALLGINLVALSFNPPPQNGSSTSPKSFPSTSQTITNLSSGIHFLYVSATGSHSLRTGIWFNIPDDIRPYARVWAWDAAHECLRDATEPIDGALARPDGAGVWDYRQLLAKAAQPAAPLSAGDASLRLTDEVPQRPPAIAADDWPALVAHVSPAVLARLTGGAAAWQVTTAASGTQDRDVIPGLDAWEAASALDEELHFLGIDLRRTWQEGAVGAERTRDARDRSAALERIVERCEEREAEDGVAGKEKVWGRSVLGEMQACFVLVLTLANYSCMEEWRRILGLALTCRELLVRREDFFLEFLGVLGLQLRHFEDVDGGLFDLGDSGSENYLKGLLRGFRKVLDQELGGSQGNDLRQAMKELEDWLMDAWSWQLGDSVLKRGMVQLEDGESVELELNGVDEDEERGEYAPMVVEL